jgi:diketogulonate reductase-like aldo/keto reductase
LKLLTFVFLGNDRSVVHLESANLVNLANNLKKNQCELFLSWLIAEGIILIAMSQTEQNFG